MDSKESQITEFKTDWRDEHLKVISAFANSIGVCLAILAISWRLIARTKTT